MKKILSLLLVACFFTSCSHDYYGDARYYDGIDRNMRPRQARFIHVKPSESMQAGIPKKTIYDFSGHVANQLSEKSEPLIYKGSSSLKMVRNGDLRQSISGLEQRNDYDDYEYYSDEQHLQTEQYRGHFKIGNPYQIYGVSYFPQNYENFEEIGIASWYGDDFHGKLTANGEIYNSNDLTAAHPTLPLPSMIRVTNLANDRSVIVRVNDRGPFAKSRIIDVSEKADEVLGFRNRGTAEVKVELLRNDTDEMLTRLRIKN